VTQSAAGPPVPKPNLYGIILRDGAPVAYLEDPTTKRVAGYRLGDAVAGGTVKLIGTDHVVLNRPEGDVNVRLRDPAKPRPVAPPQPQPGAVAPGTPGAPSIAVPPGVPGAPGAPGVAQQPVPVRSSRRRRKRHRSFRGARFLRISSAVCRRRLPMRQRRSDVVRGVAVALILALGAGCARPPTTPPARRSAEPVPPRCRCLSRQS
jgi:hypothetical protein